MERIRDRVAALDVHRDSVTAAARTLDRLTGEVTADQARFTTMTSGLGELGSWLLDRGVTTVGMEATGNYWKPVYYALEGMFDELMVLNAQHVKNVPGRKTDMSDAMWLADVVAHGMVRASFVPPAPIRALRDLTRYRRTQVDIRGREIQRLEKVLQDAGMKITSVASRVWSKSSRRMIEALIAGKRDPAELADLALGKMRPKSAQLTEALSGHWNQSHSILARQIIAHIDQLDTSIAELTEAIGDMVVPFEDLLGRMITVPGVSRTIAEIFVAETGGDMSRFPSPEQLCAWAGVAPASHESAGKHHRAGTRKGQRWLRIALIEGAKSVKKSSNFFGARYRRLARLRGANTATVAVAHSILTVMWHIANDPEATYHDLGADYYRQRQDPERQARILVAKLHNLGYTATITPAA